jgi:hypothetical protein
MSSPDVPTPFLESNAFLAASENDQETVFECLSKMTRHERAMLGYAAHDLQYYLRTFEEGPGGEA